MSTVSCTWQHVVTSGNNLSHLETACHIWHLSWSHLATAGHTWQQHVTPGNIWSHLALQQLVTLGKSWSHLAPAGYNFDNLSQLWPPGYNFDHLVTSETSWSHLATVSHICGTGTSKIEDFKDWLKEKKEYEKSISLLFYWSLGQFIGRPQTFVELQLCFKLHFYTRKMQFET